MDRRTTCIHHWLLGEPLDGGIHGVCRRCGAQRTYPNGLEPLEPPAPVPPEFAADLDTETSAPALAPVTRAALR